MNKPVATDAQLDALLESANGTCVAQLRQAVEGLRAERDRLQARCAELEQEIEDLKEERDDYAYAWAKLAVTDEELNRARAEPGGHSTAEVLERLRRIDAQG